MKFTFLLSRLSLIVLLIIAISSCEEEFNILETDIINETFATDIDSSFTIVTYSKFLQGVQSNGLPLSQIGTYTDATFGTSTVNLLSQLTLGPADIEPSFGDCTVLDSVILYIPFFSTSEVNSEAQTTFTLDSVFGNDPINISIYESNFFLSDNDPNTNFEDPQKYYSNQLTNFETNLGELIYTIENFKPESKQIILNDTVNLNPGMRVSLPLTFFEEKIINKEGEVELLNNNNFKNFFRGLYFKVSSVTENGHLAFYDFENSANPANITLYYTFKDLTNNGTCEENTSEDFNGDLQLLFNAIKVNTFSNNNIPLNLASKLNNPNTRLGEESLYLKGGEGIISIIELFGEEDFKKIGEANGASFLLDGPNGVPDELDELRTKAWLINEANLIFYVDQDQVQGGDSEPERLMIFDTKNNTVLADYGIDITANETPVNAVNQHLGRLQRDSDGNGDFYKIKITSHISNLINNDSINIPLGLMVSQNVTNQQFQELKTPIFENYLKEVPASSVISPEATVLHGNRSNTLNKRVKLKIYYTDPE